MPTVPTYNDPQVAMRPMSDAPLNLPGYSAPVGDGVRVQSQPDTAGSVGQAIGQGLTNAGSAVGQIAQDMAQQARSTMANAAYNQAMRAAQTLTYDPQQGYLSVKGADAAVPGPNGESLASTYTGKLQDQISQISQGISDPVAQRMFSAQSNNLLTQFQQGVQAHTLSEYKNWALTTQQGTATLAANQAVLGWNDPNQINPAIDQAKAAVYNAGQLQGLGAADIQANINAAVSGIHTQVIDAALKNENPTYAMAYFQQNKGQMDADDILKVQGLVNHATDSRMALTATQNAVSQFSGQINPTDSQRLLYLMNGQESNHQDFNADGTPLTSSEGAMFGMQVTPSTAADPGHGIQPAQSQTPAEYNRVGQQLAMALVQKYGNVPQALAAYNAGEGNVDKAISDAQAAGQPQNWMGYLAKYQSPDNHQQTVGYVNNVMSQFLAGQGAPAFPTESQFVSSAIQSLGQNPRIEQVQLTREQATAQYAMLQKSRDEQGQQAVMQAQQALIQNGGSMASLSPSLKMSVAQYAPGKMQELNDFAGNVADPVRSDNLALYNDLTSNPSMLVTNPQTGQPWSQTDFSNMMVQNFTQRTARALIKQREDMVSGTADTSAQSINYQALNQALNPRLESIGLNPNPVRTDTDTQQRLGGIRQYLVDQVFQQQQQSGQKLTPEQINNLVGNVFSRDVTFKTSFIGIPTGSTTTNAMSMTPADVPADVRKQITAAYAAHGVSNPTDQQILRQYWSMNGVR